MSANQVQYQSASVELLSVAIGNNSNQIDQRNDNESGTAKCIVARVHDYNTEEKGWMDT